MPLCPNNTEMISLDGERFFQVCTNGSITAVQRCWVFTKPRGQWPAFLSKLTPLPTGDDVETHPDGARVVGCDFYLNDSAQTLSERFKAQMDKLIAAELEQAA